MGNGFINLPANEVVISGEVEVTGTVNIGNLPNTQNVDGSVSIDNFPAVQPISGSVSVDNLPVSQNVNGTIDVGNFPATQTIEGSVSVSNLPAVQPVSGNVGVTSLPSIPAGSNPIGSVSVSNLPATQPISGTVSSIPLASTIATYSATAANLILASSANIFFTVAGSATKTVKIKKIVISATRTTAGTVDLYLARLSTLSTGGTFISPVAVSHDTTNPPATATITAYTANPTNGTVVGAIFVEKMFIPTASIQGTPIIWEFGDGTDQLVTLRSATENIAMYLFLVTVAGNSFDIHVTWTEQ